MPRSTAWKKALGAGCLFGVVATQAAWANAVLSISATPDPAVVGAPLALDVIIDGVADLHAHQFTLSFDPAILQAVSAEAGSFLASGGSTLFDGGTIDNTGGSIAYVFETLLGAVPAVNGSGVLALVHFSFSDAGVRPLKFSDVLLINGNLEDIAVQIDNRFLQAVPEPATMVLFGLGLAGLSLLRRR